MLKIIIHGLGRLGCSVCRLASERNEFEVVAGIKKTPVTETDFNFPVFTEIAECDTFADIMIDCSVASAVKSSIFYALDKNIPLVICTTSFDDDTECLINTVSQEIPIFQSANMSIGIHLMSRLSQMAAKSLSDINFDIEIIEKHHNGKLDAPSGTANMLANGIMDILDNKELIHDRSNRRQKRNVGEIGMHAIRGGSIVGEHIVLFAGEGETLEITHNATSREIYAAGILRAAKFVMAKPAGLYGMNDLL